MCPFDAVFSSKADKKIGGRVGGNGWRKRSRGWGKQGVELFMWKGIILVGCIWNCSALFSKREMRLRGLSLSAFLKKNLSGWQPRWRVGCSGWGRWPRTRGWCTGRCWGRICQSELVHAIPPSWNPSTFGITAILHDIIPENLNQRNTLQK